MKAKKKYGQNFLVNEGILNDINNLIDCNEDDLIIEIGPGKGALTKYLSSKNAQVICIEIDTDMKKYLDKYVSNKLTVLYQDILTVDLKKLSTGYKNIYVIGNLPYYITSPIMEYLINSNINIKKMVFMVQKEVADRYSAKVGSKNYGYFSLFLQYYYIVKEEIFVSKDSFRPIPKVDSMVISLEKKENKLNVNEKKYFTFLKEAFSHKRKTLKNNIISYNFNKVNIILEKYGLPNNVRAENISEEVFIDMVNSIE